jgi:hypothetical protein
MHRKGDIEENILMVPLVQNSKKGGNSNKKRKVTPGMERDININ